MGTSSIRVVFVAKAPESDSTNSWAGTVPVFADEGIENVTLPVPPVTEVPERPEEILVLSYVFE